MKHNERTTLLVSAAILFSAPAAWAAEPSQPLPNVNNAPVETEALGAPAPAESATEGQAAPDAPAALAPPVATAAAPNSVGASPYGNGSGDAPPAVPPAPKPRNDVPATLLASGQDYAIGGFGGVGVMYTRFAGNDRPLVCGEGGIIIDHAFTLGGGGCGIAAMMNGSKYGNAPHDPSDHMSFGYGGAIVRYHFFSRQVVNLAVGGLIGAGGVQISKWNGDGDEADYDSDNYTNKGQDAVFVAEPQIGGFANLTRWLRVGVIGGYRFVSGVETKGLSSRDLSGPTIGGQIQGGWF